MKFVSLDIAIFGISFISGHMSFPEFGEFTFNSIQTYRRRSMYRERILFAFIGGACITAAGGGQCPD